MADEELKQDIARYVDSVWEDVLGHMDELIQIESVEDMDHAEPGKPYGPAAYEALDKAVQIAAELGLDAHNCDGNIGYADVKGASERYVATIAHSDVVPVGEGWTVEPLRLTRKDGYLLGRGVLDDKGPLVLSLYAAKYFLDKGAELPYTLRAIIGNNEETNMRDVDWYLENYPQPAFLFTPDADFPLCYGEKGGWSCWIHSAPLGDDGAIVEFTGGTVGNAIPNSAYAIVRADAASLPAAERITVESAGEGLAKISGQGIGGHASKPAGTINAIGLVTSYLLDNVALNDAERTFLTFERDHVFASTDGSTLGIACEDEYFDPLTCIGGTIRTKDGHLVQSLDSRYPTAITGDEITRRVTELAAQAGASFELDIDMVPFVTDPTSEAIRTLVATYHECFNKDDEPFTMGGGTYARHFERAASFGPNMPDLELPDWVGPEHSANEGIPEQLMKDSLKLYILAIARLMRLEL